MLSSLNRVLSKKVFKKPRNNNDSGDNNLIKPIAKLKDISAPKNTNWKKWVSATKTRNYMLNDPLCDWLAEHSHNRHKVINTPKNIKLSRESKCEELHTNFTKYIMDQGVEFESNVIDLIIERVGKNNVYRVYGEKDCWSDVKVKETFNEMMKGTPIIHSGVLHNPKTETFGIPDLIVRSDWLTELVDLDTYDDKRISAPKLRDSKNIKLSPSYHYVIIDIKFSTLELRSDGIRLLNTSSFPAYKSQLYIYNEALALIQGYTPSKSFILGRKWCYTSCGIKYEGKGCFDRLGVIDYEGIDEKYIEKTKDAIEWIKDVRKPESKDWNILNYPLERKELYPNMCNQHDYPWRKAKEEIANETKEITSLWMMGVKNRESAHSKGIYKWTDKKCNPDILGVKVGNKNVDTHKVLKAMLNINKPKNNKANKSKVLPLKIKNNDEGWQDPDVLECFVDFETCNEFSNFDTLPQAHTLNLLTVIGIGYIDPETELWVYKHFTIKHLTLKDEEEICRHFSEYVDSLSKKYNVSKTKCFHWAPAENSFWKSAVDRHYPKSKKWNTCGKSWVWFDLLVIFKKEPIVIEGCLNFGLKSISNALSHHGLISTQWDSESSCKDGKGAIIGAISANKQALSQNINMENTQLMRDVINYNEVDCKCLYEIVSYLRENHI